MKLQFSNQTVKTFKDGKVTTVCYLCQVFMGGNHPVSEFKVTGKAVRSDDDKHDELYARHLADSRAKERAYSEVSHMYNKDLKDWERAINLEKMHCEFAKKMSRLKNAERRHIKKLLKQA